MIFNLHCGQSVSATLVYRQKKALAIGSRSRGSTLARRRSAYLAKQSPSAHRRPDLATLRDVHVTLAQIVTQHGEAYLPLFERIEDELAKAEATGALLDRARQVAAGASATR